MSTFGEITSSAREIYFKVRGGPHEFQCRISINDGKLSLSFSGRGTDKLDLLRTAANQVRIEVDAPQQTIKALPWDVFAGVRGFAYVAPVYHGGNDESELSLDVQEKRLTLALEAARRCGLSVLNNGLVLHSEDDGLALRYDEYRGSNLEKRVERRKAGVNE